MRAKRLIGIGVFCVLLLAVALAAGYAQTSSRDSNSKNSTDNNNYYIYEDGYNKLRCDLYNAKYKNVERLIELRGDFETTMDDWLMTVMYRNEAKINSTTPRYYNDTMGYDIGRMTLKRLEDIRDTVMADRENISPEWTSKISRLIGLRQAIDNTESLIKEIRQDITRIEDEKPKPER